MSTVDFDRFVDLVERSQLVDSSTLSLLLSQRFLQPESRTVAQMARVLIDEQLLTPWQADNLLKGKHKGFILGRYRLLGQLGRGGMSTVYLAEHELMKRRAAIKVLPRQRVNDRSYLGRFLREAQATASLDHPHIVRVYDVATEGKTHYIAMEYVEGRDLHTLVTEDGPLDVVKAADFIAQAAVGLQHAHDHGLIHRDVKPANLLANPDGVLKVLDLGLAKFHDESLPSLTIAHEDNVLGTVDYLAPEQAEDSHRVDSRVDIYGLGCTLYFLLTGHPPFPTGTLAQRVMKHQKQQPTPLHKIRPDVPFEIEDLCRRMMIKDPQQRIQTAMEVAEELVRWVERVGGSTPASRPLADLRRSSHRPVPAGAVASIGDTGFLRSGPFASPLPAGPAPLDNPGDLPAEEPADSDASDEELDLVPVDFPIPQPVASASIPPVAEPPHATGQPSEVDDERWEEQVSILEQELAPIEASSHDSLLSGERIRVERHLPASDAIRHRALLPAWAWWTIGLVALLFTVLVLVLVML